MISSAEVAKLAHRLGVSDRVIEKDYILSWLLIAIAKSDPSTEPKALSPSATLGINSAEVLRTGLRTALAFKGGTALKQIYYPDYRFSEDLDFTLCADLSHDDLIRAFGELFPWLEQQANLPLTLRSAERSVLDSTTLLINYVGPLKARLGSRYLKIDITRGELLLYPLAERALQAPYSDHPKDITLLTYTLEEILAEKLCALLGRTEPRDLYDLYWLFERGDADLTFLPANFATKCQHKGKDPTQLNVTLGSKAKTFEKLWTSRLTVQVADLPDLDRVLRVVRQHLRSVGLA